MTDEIEKIKQKAEPIFKQAGVLRAAVFGSVARGQAGTQSDIDLMVELSEPLGLLKFARLNYMLGDALERKVDLVKNTAIKPGFKNNIMRDAIYIYDR